MEPGGRATLLGGAGIGCIGMLANMAPPWGCDWLSRTMDIFCGVMAGAGLGLYTCASLCATSCWIFIAKVSLVGRALGWVLFTTSQGHYRLILYYLTAARGLGSGGTQRFEPCSLNSNFQYKTRSKPHNLKPAQPGILLR